MQTKSTSGFMRMGDVLRRIPVSKTSWWLGIQEGRFPAGCKLTPRTTAWRVSDIDELEDLLAAGKDWRDHKPSDDRQAA